jgi:FkbM family methyltransferase
VKKEISYQVTPDKIHKAMVIIRDQHEKIQARWAHGIFYETQRHGMLNYAYKKFQGGTFIDIGAAIGNHSLFFVKCCQAGQVYSFEPVKAVFDHLLQNIEANQITNIHPKNIALGEKNGQVGMILSNAPVERGGMLMSKVNESGSGVRMARLDDILLQESLEEITCIKIDVEGYCLQVLKGARQTIATYHPAIFCECETEKEFLEVDQFLAGLRYKVWKVDGKPFVMNHTPTYLW